MMCRLVRIVALCVGVLVVAFGLGMAIEWAVADWWCEGRCWVDPYLD